MKNLKPTVITLRRQGKIVGYEAAGCGHITSAVCDTRTNAVEDYGWKVAAAIGRMGSSIRFIVQHGLTIIVAADTLGFSYVIFDPERGANQMVHVGYGSLDLVETTARRHAAQNAWDFDVDDVAFVKAVDVDPAVKKELIGYFAWQRNYRRLHEAGHDEDYCRAHASFAPAAAL